MSENGHENAGQEPGHAGGEEQPRPHRVIGTPPPAQQHSMLGQREDGGGRDLEHPGPPPVDEATAKRAERAVAFFFVLSMLASIGFIAAYIGLRVGTINLVLHSNVALGTSMTVAFLSMGAGAVLWVRRLMPDVEMTEERKPVASPPEERREFEKTFIEGARASGFTSRPLLRRTLIAATVPLALAPIVLLRDMGPLPGTSLRHTVWRRGLRLVVYGTNQPIRPEDFDTAGGLITVIPEGYQDDDDELAKAVSILIKLRPGQIQPPTRLDWCLADRTIVCYSKICTHLGCPAALYEQTTEHILCPCHQSTFVAPRGALVIFGPAPRPLPQLPLMVDSDGYIAAAGDFQEPVGPSFWERG